MAPRKSSKKTGATSTPPVGTPRTQPGTQTTLKFKSSTNNTRLPKTPISQQPGGCLLNLPAEIRILIYKQMFPSDKVHVYAIQGSLHKAEDAHYAAGDHVAILTVCRTIYTEAKPVLYNNTEFCIHIRAHYWLHIWSSELYETHFGLDDFLEEPESDDWIELNPWLEDPRSIVPIDNARVLMLAVECSTSKPSYNWTWTGQIRHSLRGATNIRKLHIELKAPFEDYPYQQTSDLMFELLGKCIKCRGTVTAEMDLAIGSHKFDSRSYYKMLDGFKGIDKTHGVFSNKQAELQSEHASTLKQLRDQICLLRSKTEDRIKFTESQSSWTDYEIMKFVPAKLNTNIEGVLKEMVGLESSLQRVEKDLALLQRRREALKVREVIEVE